MESTCEENKGVFPKEFEVKLTQALEMDLPYTERLLRPADRRAAILALFAWSRKPDEANPTGVSLLVTRRTDSVQSHQGQMAFPGGRCEEAEIAHEDFLSTALRETEEEVGISRNRVRIVGMLPELTTVSDYRVMPFVGILQVPLEEALLKLDPAEVAEALWIPWSVLTAPSTYEKEFLQRGAIRFPTHVYTVDRRRIWGATGAMIKNLLDRFERIG